jgi:hypothetical protein
VIKTSGRDIYRDLKNLKKIWGMMNGIILLNCRMQGRCMS